MAEVDRPISVVAKFAADPDNAPRWYENNDSVEWITPRPVELGSRVAFVARFSGRRLRYTYEVVEVIPNSRFVMRTTDGPFPMETTYEWEPLTEERTRMRLRNRGSPTGFGVVVAALLAMAMRRENREDLRRLEELLETSPP